MKVVRQIEIPTLAITLIATARSESSACFEAVNSGASLAKGASVGWVDVHYPCDSHIRLTIHAVLPERLIAPDLMREIASAIKTGLEIPAPETLEMVVCSPNLRMGFSQSADEKGRPGRIETTRRFTFNDKQE